jgi:hypothetical protein
MQNDPVAVTLLPCPFCGGEGIEKAEDGGVYPNYFVRCAGCKVRIWGSDNPEVVRARWNTRATTPATGDGQDRKFAFRDGQFVNRVSGEPIPHDEPIIIFRARDRHSIPVLREYLTMATDEHHRQAIRDRLTEFAAYRDQHPERMKEPGITHDMVLATPKPPVDEADKSIDQYAYDELWDAIAAATHVEAGVVVISVVKFREAIRTLPDDGGKL